MALVAEMRLVFGLLLAFLRWPEPDCGLRRGGMMCWQMTTIVKPSSHRLNADYEGCWKMLSLSFFTIVPIVCIFRRLSKVMHIFGCRSGRLKRPSKTKLLARQKTLSQRRSRRSPSTFGTGADVSMSWSFLAISRVRFSVVTLPKIGWTFQVRYTQCKSSHSDEPLGAFVTVCLVGFYIIPFWWGVCRVLFCPLGDGFPKVLTKQQEPDTYGNISMDDVKKYGAVTTWADSHCLGLKIW